MTHHRATCINRDQRFLHRRTSIHILLFGIKKRKEKKRKEKKKNQTNKQKINSNLSKYFGIMKTSFHRQGRGLLPIKASNEHASSQLNWPGKLPRYRY